MTNIEVIQGDSRDAMKMLADNSIDSLVTDPPYALVSIAKRFGKPGSKPANSDIYKRATAGFMSQTWDTGETAFAIEFWAECLRVLKPGGHIAAFGGTRTYHRLAVAIEDAGFEIRDQLAWMYGTGFPKSHDVSKGIDKRAGHWRGRAGKIVVQEQVAKGTEYERTDKGDPITAAAAWKGWGTALKPSLEPICLAHKPLSEKSVAANVLKWGTGAINIDGCRIALCADDDPRLGGNGSWTTTKQQSGDTVSLPRGTVTSSPLGRWPANVVHDGSDEVVSMFPDAGKSSGGSGPASKEWRGDGSTVGANFAGATGGFGDRGSAARFYYSAKADKLDRWGSKHPTVKPVNLMRWLCRLITPPGGTVLDPFAGSGSTGIAALSEGFDSILIEREPEYVADIRARIAHVKGEGVHSGNRLSGKDPKDDGGPLFAEVSA